MHRSPQIILLIAAASLLCQGCGRHVDSIAALASSDGAIIASSNTNTGEFPFEPQFNEVRLYPRGGRLKDGSIVLSYGEDDSRPVFAWIGPQTLSVQLPCGWWSGLTNHYQLPKTDRIVEIVFKAPPSNCPTSMTSSTAMPVLKN